MARNYTVHTKIHAPAADVFAAIVSREKLCHYFTDEASSDLVEGAEVKWRWKHYHATLPVVVSKVIPNELIELTINSRAWEKTIDEEYDVKVIFEFESLEDGATMLAISEEGWKTNKDGLKGSHENCGGWTHMAMCLKGWIEHGIDMRWE